MSKKDFQAAIEQGYTCKGEHFIFGTGIYDGKPVDKTHINIPLKTLNRHGLIAGATGSGKTKTIQLLAEKLSHHGVPSMVMDLKGDLSGLGAAATTNEKINERQNHIGTEWNGTAFPVELLSLSDEPGVRLRATIAEFGPVLFSKMLDLNDTQTGIMAVIFKYCKDQKLPLLDLKDIQKVLNYAVNEGKNEFEKNYGRISSSSVGTISRKIVELEQQGAELFFGEPSFDVNDLIRRDSNGHGIISILRLTDMQERNKLFSTFMLVLLAEMYRTFPEIGDVEKPKLMIFIDEAHLVFDNASKAVLQQIETIIKLIRSKGVGIFFVTQNPTDVPEAVLGQLGMKVQHALRAFTAKDRKAIKLTAQNYPLTEFYKTDQLLTELGIGEAAVTVLSEKGRPTPLAATLLCAPESRMAPLNPSEIQDIVGQSQLAGKYNTPLDRHSASEILKDKIESIHESHETIEKETVKAGGGSLESLSKNPMVRRLGNTIVREVMRAILVALGIRRR